MIASGTPVEVAAQEVGVSVKEALRWHREHPLLEPHISGLREENYQRLSEQTLNQYLHLLTQISDQLQTKIDNGKDITIKELKDAFSLQSEVGTVLRQHEMRKEEAAKEKATVKENESIFDLWRKHSKAEWTEFTKKSMVKDFGRFSKPDQNEVMAQLKEIHG
jgi:hypothetical protein